LISYVENKIQAEFIATCESDKTLYSVMELEQKLGRNINWVTGKTFDSIIKEKKRLPNFMWRFCTSEMKMQPIFDFCRNEIKEVVQMRIGFRYDELERANYENKYMRQVVGTHEEGRHKGKKKWENVYWRELNFPLIDNKISHYNVQKWAQTSGISFPNDSNCVGCFWKPIPQIRKNWDDEPLKMRWFSEQEKQIKKTFKKGISYEKAKEMALQLDFFFGGDNIGCKSGVCIS
jgi:hypothetical protein